MAKVLFLPIGVGLAHTGRSIMIARELEKRGVDVAFGAGGDAVALLEKEHFPFFPLPEFKRAVYERKVKNNNFFIYSRKTIETYVRAELDLYDKVKPDLVVFDTRITAKISSQIAKIPVISVNNSDVTPYYDYSKTKFPATTSLEKFLPPRILALLDRGYGQRLLRIIGPKLMQAVLLAMIIKCSQALLKLGYKFSRDPYQFFSGDLTLLADIPQYRPVTRLPDNYKMVGPIFWDGGEKLPCWQKEVEGKKEIIYVTAGGTGDKEIFLKILEFLEETNFTVVATAGNTLKPSAVRFDNPNIFVTDIVPGAWIMKRAKLVIFPGGNLTAYQALSFGVPQICTPFHIDQEDNANQLVRLGTGIMLNPRLNFSKDALLNAVGRIMVDEKYKANAKRMQKILAGYHGAKTAAEEIIKYIDCHCDPESASWRIEGEATAIRRDPAEAGQ
ncbi:hypothetical protein MUP32_00865, partial [Candidatus Microgenomates bacterium]|nr:hypothetical protein [Candidatus Microgenomates bacterium]